jgi:glycosyltransferase involved in cell wall biosynthesis
VYDSVRARVPLDLVGMGAEPWEGGLGEVRHDRLPAFQAAYRFVFNPIRYTSLGLAVCEAMMLGMPVVGLATTEMASAVQHGVTGYVSTDVEALIPLMQGLLRDPEAARRLGAAAREYALDRFNIHRFVRNWNAALRDVTGVDAPGRAAGGAGEVHAQAHCHDQ